MWPATVTAPLDGNQLPVRLDLGCRLTLPTIRHVAGLTARRKTALSETLAQHLPAGTALHIVGDPANDRAHLVDSNNRLVLDAVKGRDIAPPLHGFGIIPGRGWRYPGVVRHVIDADTIAIDLDLGCPVTWTAHIRIQHLNAPEHGTTAGDLATEWARRHLPEGAPVTVTSRRIEKYGRLLGDITDADGTDYGSALLAAGHAQPYEGGLR